jgi:ATP-binding cassette subfamily B multidrug efflux pump
MSNFSVYQKKYIYPLWLWYLAGIVLLALVNVVNLQIPQLAKKVINDLTAKSNAHESLETAVAIIGLGFLLIIVRALSRVLMFWPSRKAEANSKADYFKRVTDLPAEFFEKHGMGDLISRLANDIGHVRIYYGFGLLQILNVVFLLAFTIIQMGSVHPTLTFYALMPLLLMFVITKTTMAKMHKYSKANQVAVGQLTNKVTESFVNVHVLQANAATESFAERIEAENEEVYASNVKLIFIRTVIFPLMTCLAGISQLVILFYGGSEIIAGRLTIGDILAFNVYIALLTFPLTALGIFISVHQRAKTALERLQEINQGQPRVFSSSSVKSINDSNPALGFNLSVKHLSYSFPEKDKSTEKRVLTDLSLELSPGDHIGLYGPIGSGKSTLFNLVVRYYEPPKQTIFLNGIDLVDLDPKFVRKTIGYALQSVHLFSNSVRENMLFGLDKDVSEDDIIKAADAAQILGEIKAFSDGWDTQIGEKGIRLSGGQKQRLALARVFLRKPPILLLDDVLSAVDHSTEKKILSYIMSLGTSMIISSHRGSALRHCKEILVLDLEGKVTDRGSYNELVKRHPSMVAE